MSPLPGSPLGPLWREMPISRAFPYISFKVPHKGAPHPGSPDRAPTESDAPFPEPSFIILSKSLGNEPTPGSRVGPLPISRALLYISFRVPTKGDPSRFP